MRRGRHGRACPGHPRREVAAMMQGARRGAAWMPGTRPGMTAERRGKNKSYPHSPKPPTSCSRSVTVRGVVIGSAARRAGQALPAPFAGAWAGRRPGSPGRGARVRDRARERGTPTGKGARHKDRVRDTLAPVRIYTYTSRPNGAGAFRTSLTNPRRIRRRGNSCCFGRFMWLHRPLPAPPPLRGRGDAHDPQRR